MEQETNQDLNQATQNDVEESDSPVENTENKASSKTEQVSQIGDILKEALGGTNESSESEGFNDNVSEDERKKVEKIQSKTPADLAETAEKIGVDIKDVYNIKVPLGEGQEPVTIGQLKDEYRGREEHSIRELAWNEDRLKQQSELEERKAELKILLEAIPADQLNKEIFEKVQQKAQERAATERKKTLEKIPEWSNEDTRKAELTEMIDHLKQYGFEENYLQYVQDHRLLAYMREQYQREKRLRAALDKVKKVHGKTLGASKGGSKPGKRPKPGVKGNSAASSRTRQAEQVSEILRQQLK